ncbi:site-specific integrase [Massilia arenosa]|uniref:Site-specific integrase n=1 Tax=Zemynaea arenosa TaxID=2561931 RepID=A0A4Y9S2N3_9BURK|nr:site-specific integrase [Massilia arenosa]TFW15433.1 site-specific integrase [Massilia arenosa]
MSDPIKVGRRWKHRIMVNGKRVAGTFDTKAEAIKWEAEERVRLSRKDGILAPPGATCRDAFRKYELEVSKTKKGYRWEAMRLAAMAASPLGKVLIEEVNPSHIAEWRNDRLKKVQGSTVVREMNLLSHVFTIARKEWRWIKESPTRDVRRPKENKPRDRRPSEDEIKTMCTVLGWPPDSKRPPVTAGQRVAIAFLFAIETGMRCGELCHLRPNDVEGSVAHVGDSKNDDARDVPLSQRAQELWSYLPQGFQLKEKDVDNWWRRYRAKTPIKGLRFHDSRHEAITRLANKLNVLDLARVIGHRDINQLMTYYNATPHEIAARLG